MTYSSTKKNRLESLVYNNNNTTSLQNVELVETLWKISS